MAEREKNKKLQELFDKKVPVYSYSKLSSWYECKYNYYQTYILHKRSKDNIYSKIGTVVHDSIENIYQHRGTLKDAQNNFNKTIKSCEVMGIKFPKNPPTTKINYLKNMEHFFKNYKILDTEMITEQFVLYKVPRIKQPKEDKDYIWIQMYIDSVIPCYDKDGNFISVIINDWKTSSKFTKDKLKKAGRQLLVYKLGTEQMTGVPVSKIGWTMLKYAYACYKTKGSKNNPPKIKKSMQQRKEVVKFFHKKLVNEFIKMGKDTLEAELIVGKMINKNDLLLPDELKNKYWIEDCFLEYEITDEKIQECNEWIVKTVNEIESLDKNINNYPPIKIDDKNNYFCFNLCGRPDCIYLQKYRQEHIGQFKKDKKEKIINKLFQNNNKDKIKFDIDSLFK